MDTIIVNWNGRRFLPRCLEALARLTIPVHVVVVDNASTDGSVDYLRTEHPDVELIALTENLGYAGGANVGLRATDSEYAIILNPDVVLEPDHLAILQARLDADPHVGAAQGKLYQVRPDDYTAGRFSTGGVLDSAGHHIARTRMVYDRGQGKPEASEHQEERSVFSACGAALFLRRSTLEDLAPDGEYFDESFFAYKEDIDLCWRARQLGWDIRYVPEAVGHHVRGWAGSKPPAPHLPPLVARRHSWKNHYLLVLKNDDLSSILRSLPHLIGWEVLRQGHALLRDRAVYGAYKDLWRLLPQALRRRRELMRRRRVPPTEMRRWFGGDAT